MRKEYLFILLALFATTAFQAQTKGTKVGYIDMEYILQNVPGYMDAQNQLEQKAQVWKQEIETKKNEIDKLKEALKAEKALLTKALIEERNSEIGFLENQLLEYQQKRFGPSGDLMTQKNGLSKPIQDQVFSAVQDIAETKKYDFIFDKTSDLTLLFAAKRYDISDQIVRILNRTEKREQLTKKQLKEEEEREAKAEAMYDNPELAKKQKSLDARKAARDAAIANRVAADEERKRAAEERKLKIIADREAKKNGISPAETASPSTTTEAKKAAADAANEAKKTQAEQRAEATRVRNQQALDKKNALEDRRLQIIQEREAKKTNTIIPTEETQATKAAETNKTLPDAKQKQAEARAKTIEERKKIAEENKKAQEEKRKQTIDAKKTGTVSEKTEKEAVTKSATDKSKQQEINPINPAEQKTNLATTAEAKQKQADTRAKNIEERNKLIEERKKAIEDKKKKVIEDREAAKKANATKENTNNN